MFTSRADGKSFRRRRGKNRRRSRVTQGPVGYLPLQAEQLESRLVLAPAVMGEIAPLLDVTDDTAVNEGDYLSIEDIGSFSYQNAGSPGSGVDVGLDPNEFLSLGDFDPVSDVTIDTTSLVMSGGLTAAGTSVTVDGPAGTYEVAVFAFDHIEVDASITVTATGSRPLALLSQSGVSIAGVIDVSASWEIPGPGGGAGGTGPYEDGHPAAGAPVSSAGQAGLHPLQTLNWGGGGGGAFGGDGGGGKGHGSLVSGIGGTAYGDLSVALQGGSGGGTGTDQVDGGGGGGGIELGAVDTLTVLPSGRILANGADGSLYVKGAGVGGGGGAGGGILVHGLHVNVQGALEADGGDAHSTFVQRYGGGGGGGRILVAYGETVTQTGTYSVSAGGTTYGPTGDPGTLDVIAASSPPAEDPVFTYMIDWDDSSTPDMGVATVDVPGSPDNPTLGSFDGSHIYADNGIYSVTVTLQDDDGPAVSDTLMVEVLNVLPTLDAGADRTGIDEGTLVSLDGATFSDPGFDNPADGTLEDFTATIDWGDGHVEPAATITLVETAGGAGVPTTGTIDAAHVYADNGVYTVTITVQDDDGPAVSDTFQVDVDNVAPEIFPMPVLLIAPSCSDAAAGDPVYVRAEFSDPGFDNDAPGMEFDTREEFSATSIDWGDGRIDTTADFSLAVVPGSTGLPTTGVVEASHVYNSGGVFDVTVTVRDDDGGVATLTTTRVIVGVGLHNGQLQIVGTAEKDKIDIKLGSDGGSDGGGDGPMLKVKAKFGKGSGDKVDFRAPAADVDSILILLCDGNDKAKIHSNVAVDAWIVGAGGDDDLHGGAGNDRIDGGAGDDKLDGGGGNDLLDGGAGHDRLLGGSDGGSDGDSDGGLDNGADILLGGPGDDRLDGGRGRDLLIGGRGADTLDGDRGDDILIGGVTTYDTNPDALHAVMAEWTSGASYLERIAHLNGSGGGAGLNGAYEFIAAGDDATVFDDGDRDTLEGGKGYDWFFADRDGSDGDQDKVKDLKSKKGEILDLL